MKKFVPHIAALAIALAAGSYLVLAQQPPAGGGQGGRGGPPQPMSFFITSAGSGKGADLGGIAGADRICQTLATAAGSTKTFHAYLSSPAANGQAAVNARDRIGAGPWFNAKGARIASRISCTLPQYGESKPVGLTSTEATRESAFALRSAST